MPPVPLVPHENASSAKSDSENPRSKNDIKDMSGGTNDTNDILHTPFSNEELKYFDIDKVEIVNIHSATGFPICDAYIGRRWKESYGPPPLIGADGPFADPFVVGKDGTLEEVLAKYGNWLWNGIEVVNGYDPKEYRRKAINELPGFYKWGCHCKPKACHGDILKKWLKRELQKQRARKTYDLRHTKGSTKEGGDTE